MAELTRIPITEPEVLQLSKPARGEDGELVHMADLPSLLGCGGMPVFCFVFCLHGNFLPKGKGCLPHSLNRLLTSFFAFSVLPCLLPKASLGKPEQKVAGTWPVCPPRKAPSQKEVPLTEFLAFDVQSGKEAWPSALDSIKRSVFSLLSPMDM